MKASTYRASGGEANFGKPIITQIVGGTHITFEMITKSGDTFYATRWPHGLPGHNDPPNTLRFPHGLIRFGESIESCARRLVRAQLGLHARHIRIAYWDSHVDDLNHWHIEPGCLVETHGAARVPRGAAEIVTFQLSRMPKMTYWTRATLSEVLRDCAPELLGVGPK